MPIAKVKNAEENVCVVTRLRQEWEVLRDLSLNTKEWYPSCSTERSKGRFATEPESDSLKPSENTLHLRDVKEEKKNTENDARAQGPRPITSMLSNFGKSFLKKDVTFALDDPFTPYLADDELKHLEATAAGSTMSRCQSVRANLPTPPHVCQAAIRPEMLVAVSDLSRGELQVPTQGRHHGEASPNQSPHIVYNAPSSPSSQGTRGRADLEEKRHSQRSSRLVPPEWRGSNAEATWRPQCRLNTSSTTVGIHSCHSLHLHPTPCEAYQKRMERFRQWYLQREKNNKKRQALRRLRERENLPHFRQAFSVCRPQEDLLTHCAKIHRVYMECKKNCTFLSSNKPRSFGSHGPTTKNSTSTQSGPFSLRLPRQLRRSTSTTWRSHTSTERRKKNHHSRDMSPTHTHATLSSPYASTPRDASQDSSLRYSSRPRRSSKDSSTHPNSKEFLYNRDKTHAPPTAAAAIGPEDLICQGCPREGDPSPPPCYCYHYNLEGVFSGEIEYTRAPCAVESGNCCCGVPCAYPRAGMGPPLSTPYHTTSHVTHTPEGAPGVTYPVFPSSVVATPPPPYGWGPHPSDLYGPFHVSPHSSLAYPHNAFPPHMPLRHDPVEGTMESLSGEAPPPEMTRSHNVPLHRPQPSASSPRPLGPKQVLSQRPSELTKSSLKSSTRASAVRPTPRLIKTKQPTRVTKTSLGQVESLEKETNARRLAASGQTKGSVKHSGGNTPTSQKDASRFPNLNAKVSKKKKAPILSPKAKIPIEKTPLDTKDGRSLKNHPPFRRPLVPQTTDNREPGVTPPPSLKLLEKPKGKSLTKLMKHKVSPVKGLSKVNKSFSDAPPQHTGSSNDAPGLLSSSQARPGPRSSLPTPCPGTKQENGDSAKAEQDAPKRKPLDQQATPPKKNDAYPPHPRVEGKDVPPRQHETRGPEENDENISDPPALRTQAEGIQTSMGHTRWVRSVTSHDSQAMSPSLNLLSYDSTQEDEGEGGSKRVTSWKRQGRNSFGTVQQPCVLSELECTRVVQQVDPNSSGPRQSDSRWGDTEPITTQVILNTSSEPDDTTSHEALVVSRDATVLERVTVKACETEAPVCRVSSPLVHYRVTRSDHSETVTFGDSVGLVSDDCTVHGPSCQSTDHEVKHFAMVETPRHLSVRHVECSTGASYPSHLVSPHDYCQPPSTSESSDSTPLLLATVPVMPSFCRENRSPISTTLARSDHSLLCDESVHLLSDSRPWPTCSMEEQETVHGASDDSLNKDVQCMSSEGEYLSSPEKPSKSFPVFSGDSSLSLPVRHPPLRPSPSHESLLSSHLLDNPSFPSHPPSSIPRHSRVDTIPRAFVLSHGTGQKPPSYCSYHHSPQGQLPSWSGKHSTRSFYSHHPSPHCTQGPPGDPSLESDSGVSQHNDAIQREVLPSHGIQQPFRSNSPLPVASPRGTPRGPGLSTQAEWAPSPTPHCAAQPTTSSLSCLEPKAILNSTHPFSRHSLSSTPPFTSRETPHNQTIQKTQTNPHNTRQKNVRLSLASINDDPSPSSLHEPLSSRTLEESTGEEPHINTLPCQPSTFHPTTYYVSPEPPSCRRLSEPNPRFACATYSVVRPLYNTTTVLFKRYRTKSMHPLVRTTSPIFRITCPR